MKAGYMLRTAIGTGSRTATMRPSRVANAPAASRLNERMYFIVFKIKRRDKPPGWEGFVLCPRSATFVERDGVQGPRVLGHPKAGRPNWAQEQRPRTELARYPLLSDRVDRLCGPIPDKP